MGDGKNFPTEMAVRADIKETMAALTPILEKGGQNLKSKSTKNKEVLRSKNWTKTREGLTKQLKELPKSGAIDPSWMLMTIIDLCLKTPFL
ncbi:MAG: hypothetical protein CM15mP62_27280 [Rhodospirillaceae bacterium]|nr:MAG: hypothetical protein CM15mP62_27280 [Rhodospirillaceae bacterium]